MPAADRDPGGRVELTREQAAELYDRIEQRAALLRAGAAPEPARPRRRRPPRQWRFALPALAAALAAVLVVWTHAGSSPPPPVGSLDAFTMGPTVARPQPSVGESGPVYALAPLLGFQVLLPHTPLANPRLLSGAWTGEIAPGADGGAPVYGIALDFPSTGLRIVEMPWASSPGSRLAATTRYSVRSAIAGRLLVRVISFSDSRTQQQLEGVLRSLR